MITQTESVLHIAVAAAASTAMVGYALIGRRRGRGVRELWLVGGAIGALLTCGVALADFNHVVVQSNPRGLAVPLIALSAGLLFAVRLFTIGLRGRRVGDHPHCRRCGFDLFGRPATSSVCPECGVDLDAPRATVVGVRQRRPVAMLVGCFALILTLAYGSVVGRDVYRWAATYDWTPHKPASWLADDLFSSSSSRATNPSSQRAGDALVRRADAGTLGRMATARLVDRLLATRVPWPTMPGEHPETMLAARIALAAWARGEIDEPLMRRVMRAELDGSLQIAPQASRGRTLRYWIALGDYAQLGSRYGQVADVTQTFEFRDRADALNGLPLPKPFSSKLRTDFSQYLASEALGNAFNRSPIGDALPPGPATLTTRFTAKLTLVARGRPTVVETRDVALTGTTMLVPPAAMACPPILVGTEPATPVVNASLVTWDPAGPALAIHLVVNGTLLADVVLRADGTERTLGTVCIVSGNAEAVPLGKVPAGPYEIVLRPTPERGADLFSVVPTFHVPIVVPSSEIGTAGAGDR